MGEVVDQQGVDGSEEKRVDRPLEGLKGDSLYGGLLGILEEVLNEFAVVEGEPKQPPDAEDNEEEEKEDEGDVGQLVAEVEAEEGPALVEEVEGELLDVPLVDDEEEHAREGVLPDVLRQPVVEQQLEHHHEQHVYDDGEGQLEEEEVQVVGEEAHPVAVLAEEEGVGVVLLVVEGLDQVLVEGDVALADIGLAAGEEGLHELALLVGHLVDAGEQGL